MSKVPAGGLNQLVKELVEQGMSPDKAGPAAMQYLSQVASRNQGGIGSALRNEVLANSAVAGGGALLSTLFGSQNPANTVPMGGKGFIFSPQDMYQYTQYYNSPGARLARATGVDMPTPEKYRQDQIESVDQQMQASTARDILRTQAQKQAESEIRGMELEAALREQSLIQEGKLGVQEISSLGDVQKQRVQSGYEAASNMLQKAIENIAYVEKLGGDQVAQGLTSLPSI